MNDTLPCRPQERDLLARSVFVLIGVACLALGCGALAQGNEPPTGSEGGATTGPMLATELLAALDADDVDERAEAADAILRDDSISDESIYYTLTEADFLTPEQHAWLLRIAEGRRFYEPGVIGIWMDTNRQQMGPGVGVARVMEAAPAFEVLLAGDIILAINGHVIGVADPRGDLQFAVAAGRAGDLLIIELMRRGQRLIVQTKLADPATLPDFRGTTLDASRIEQWAAIRSALEPLAEEMGVVDETGTEIDGRKRRDLSNASSTSSRRSGRNQQERELRSEIIRLDSAELASRRLVQMAQSLSLRRALVIQLDELVREKASAIEELDKLQEPIELNETGAARPADGG